MPKKDGPNFRSRFKRATREVVTSTSKEVEKYIPPCDHLTDLFYGEEVDLRDEIGREVREAIAVSMCLRDCDARFSCLEFALHDKHGKLGVWGGMSSGERRQFKIYLRKQGYREIPYGAELRLAINIYEGNDGSKEAANE